MTNSVTMATRSRNNKNTLTPVSRIGNNKNVSTIDQLSEEHRALYMLISSKFDETITELKQELKLKDDMINKLETDIVSLRRSNQEILQRLDDVECRERNDSVILSGPGLPSASDHENVQQIAEGMMRDKLRCKISSGDILSSSRVGRRPSTQAPDRRNILVRFRTNYIRDDIITSAKKTKPTGFFVNENLTPARSKILFYLRKAKRSFPNKVNACGSLHGRIFVWLRSSQASGKDYRLFINSTQELEDFLKKNFDTGMDEIFGETRSNVQV